MKTYPLTPNYGVDAHGLVRLFFMAGAGALALQIPFRLFLISYPTPQSILTIGLAVIAAYMFGMGCLMLYESKVVKVKDRERLLDLVEWRGNESVLDVGCGRGMMLVGAARRLTTGNAIGIDIWQAEDQSSNTAEAALTNARLEGVRDRIAVQTADMRKLPFEDQSFDVIVTNWVVHNLKAENDRKRAIEEMARVVKDGGMIVIADIKHVNVYEKWLVALGFTLRGVIVRRIKNAILNVVTFGSFQPNGIAMRRPI